jgi:hypothetical protein
LNNNLKQGESLTSLTDQVDKMLSGISRMDNQVQQLGQDIDQEFDYAEKYAHRWQE